MALLEQISIVTAAKEAGVKRVVPCGFATVCPEGGVMKLRDRVSLFYPPSFLENEFFVRSKIWPEVCAVEGRSPQSHQAAFPPLHIHRCRVLVSILLPTSAIRQDRQVSLPGYEFENAWRWHGAELNH
jgi:hypothetical protein